MRHLFLSLVLLLVAPLLTLGQQNRAVERPALAFTHVTVIDATGAPAKPDMTVIIAGSRIVALGKTGRVRVPKGARIIDARGKFLVPGLWDMHVHIGNDELDRSSTLPLFIANGVTGVRVMAGLTEHHLYRHEIESGNLLGPRMVIASSRIDESKTFAVKGRLAVRKAKEEGADFFKVFDSLPRAGYFAVIDEARRAGLPVAGHVPASVTAAEAARAGQRSIEHFTGLSEAEADPRKADHVIAVLKTNHTWLCPTLIMRNNYAVLDDRRLVDDPRLRYVKPSWRRGWLNMTNGAANVPAAEWVGRRETVRREKALVGRMQRGGVGILAGSDLANPYLAPGFSLHDELAMLVDSGLTTMQALQTATLNPAKFFNKLNSLGTIEKGKLADLVLLDANPLQDIHNTNRISMVVVNGRLLPRNSLDQILREVDAAMNKE